MNPETPHIIDTETESTQNNFPILAQLGVLGILTIGIFSAFYYQKVSTQPEPVVTKVDQALTQNTDNHPIVPQKLSDINIRAESAYVWDINGQRALYSKNADESLPLASITKLMTALLAYELIDQNNLTTVSASAVSQEGSSGFLVGEQLSAEELSSMALISSSNDAAYALAANVGALLGDNDPATQFIQGMNIRADELGLETLQFWNTTGLDLSETQPGSTGSARDISFLMEYIVTNHPDIVTPTRQTGTRVYNTIGTYHEIENTNQIANQIPNLIGSKTGFTDLAGGNLTIAFDAGLNRPIVITVLGSTVNERFTDVLTLVEAVQESLSKQ